MGIKSTTELTREQCINRIINHPFHAKLLKEEYAQVSNEDLENALEALDESNGNIFDNYMIVENKE